jgi:hypothetical protein
MLTKLHTAIKKLHIKWKKGGGGIEQRPEGVRFM